MKNIMKSLFALSVALMFVSCSNTSPTSMMSGTETEHLGDGSMLLATTAVDNNSNIILWNEMNNLTSVRNSIYGSNGVIVGGVTTVPSLLDMGIHFNSLNEYITFPLWAPGEKKWGTDEITLECWASTPFPAQFGKVIVELARGVISDQARINLAAYGSTRMDALAGYGLPFQYRLVDWSNNNFHHFAISVSKTKAQFYHQGVLRYEAPLDTRIIGQPMGYELMLSNRTDNHENIKWVGTLDNVKVFGYAKTDFSDRFNKKILWNKLGTVDGIKTSTFGPGGIITGTIINVSAKYGSGVVANKDTNGVAFPLFAQDSKKFGTDELTIEFWGRSWYTGQKNKYLFDLSEGKTTVNGYIDLVASGTTGFSVAGASTNNALVANYPWQTTTFDHFAVTVSKTTVKVFINGVEKYASPLRADVIGQSIPYLLKLSGIPGYKWNGVFDNLKVYNYAKVDFSDRMKE